MPSMASEQRSRRPYLKRAIQLALSLVIVFGIFAYAIPRIADYSAVMDTIGDLTPIEFASLFAAMLFNLFTYWVANMAALPGLSLPKSAVVTQTTTSVANTLPAGGAIAVGLTFQILHSWGFSAQAITLYIGVTGVWNIFVKLALPVISLALSSKGFARRIGDRLGRVISWLRRPFRKPAITTLGDQAVDFRERTIVLVAGRWLRITGTTIVSQLALWLVLLLSLRHVGISEQEVSTLQSLAVFAFGRLLGAIPITPGGLGVIELGYIGGLVAAGGNDAQVVAAVLLFRVLTYGIQIPIGGVTLAIRGPPR